MLDIPIVFENLNDAPKNDTTSKEFSFCDYHAQRYGNFSCRRLRDISTFFEAFKFSESLDLSKNLITNIPSGIEQYRLLTFLDLSFNKIFSIPSALCKLTNLRILLISNNYLSSLPPNISDLQCLQELDLSSNRFKSFPFSVCSFRSLKVLLLGCNLIGILPEEIIGLRHLRILDIHSNQLKQLPLNIRFMVCLEKLSLEENPLSFPPLFIITRGIPYIFAYLNQHAECNSNNTSCEKFHDSLTESSAHVIITSNRHNTMKQSDSQFEESAASSSYMNMESVQKSISNSEVTNPSTLQNFTYSTVNNKKEQLHDQNENQYLSSDCTHIEQSIHNELTDSCLNEILKSGSSISSLSTDDEPITVEMCCSTYENINFNKNESRSDSSQESINISTTINNSQIKQPVSTYNGISKKDAVSTTSLDENDDVVSNNSGVKRVSNYIITDEKSPSFIKSINDDQAEDYSTSHLRSKYDHLSKKSVISRSKCSKRHQIIHDRNLHSSSGYVTPNSHLSESYSTPQMNVYRCRSVSQCHTNEQSDNSMNSTQVLCNPNKNDLCNEDVSNKTCIGIALYMPSECTFKKPPMFQSSYNHQLQTNTNCQNRNVSYTTGYLSNNIKRSNDTYDINTSESRKINSVNNPVKWEELNSNELSKINQLRRIIDKELNIRLPINPKQLAIELSTGVILIHLVNKFIGTTSKNIRVYVPRNDQRNNLLNEVIKSYRRNLRRCREWIHRFGVPRECLFSTESVVNPQTADGLLSLANSITIMYNIRNKTKSTMNTTSNKLINNFITNTDCQYQSTFSQVRTTSPSSQQQQQQRQSSHHPLHHQQQLTKKTVNNRRLYHMNMWPNHLCSDV